MSVVLEWLDRLYGNSPGYFTVCAFDHGRIVSTKWYATSELARAARTIEHAAESYDIYVSVATHVEPQTGKSRGSTKTVQSIAGFWADLDIGTDGHKAATHPNPKDEAEALSILDGLPEPTAVIHSGGGLQAWWFFDEPWVFNDATEAASASDAWQRLLVERAEAKGLHVDSVGDLPRILRVPGTANHKLAEPRPVELRAGDGPAHALVELSALGPSRAASDSLRTPDALGSPLGSWADILTPHGWTEVGVRVTDGATLWRRPDKTEGHSAVTDPYGVPVLVNFSSSSDLPTGPGQKLSKFKVWAHLNFNGDEKAAKAALARITKDSPDKLKEIADRFNERRFDWTRVFTEVDPDPEWLVEPLVERGRQVAFFSEAKAGKSLVWLEIAAALVRGLPVLGNPPRKPITIVYIDQENTKRDVVERLTHMGHDGNGLERLLYYSFPDLSYLDTETGGRELYAVARVADADLVILDTLSRVVEGDENENDTYHNFYKYTGVRLKADGIALVRLDHSGKDKAKGMRGASSKYSDVDEVWQLTADDHGIVTLNRTHSRAHHGASRIVLTREDAPLRHATDERPETTIGLPSDDEVMVWLDLLGVSATLGARAAWNAVRDSNDRKYTARQVMDAQRKRKAQIE
jgi:AAA domain